MRGLSSEGERRGRTRIRGRAVADPEVDRPRLDHEMAVVVVEAEVLRSERERDRLRLPGVGGQALEPLELLYGLEDRRVALVGVELRDVGARHRTRICDGGGDF